VKADVGIAREQRRPFGERFLDAVLAKVELARLDQQFDLFGWAALADGNQLDLCRITPGELRGATDALEDSVQSVCGIAHSEAL
jgi:hypothetical protein